MAVARSAKKSTGRVSKEMTQKIIPSARDKLSREESIDGLSVVKRRMPEASVTDPQLPEFRACLGTRPDEPVRLLRPTGVRTRFVPQPCRSVASAWTGTCVRQIPAENTTVF